MTPNPWRRVLLAAAALTVLTAIVLLLINQAGPDVVTYP